jgi:hypothetical protein
MRLWNFGAPSPCPVRMTLKGLAVVAAVSLGCAGARAEPVHREQARAQSTTTDSKQGRSQALDQALRPEKEEATYCPLHRPEAGHPPSRVDIPPPCSGESVPGPGSGTGS